MPSPIPEYFALFGLQPRFAIDQQELTRAYRAVQAHVHPDRHAAAGAAERRAAMQLASHANEAYLVLKSDSARAAYLCRSRGTPTEGEGAPALDPAFLEQQLEWRESFEQARAAGDAQAIAALARTVGAERARRVECIAALLDERGDHRGAAQEVRALLFLEKLAAEIEGYYADRADATATRG